MNKLLLCLRHSNGITKASFYSGLSVPLTLLLPGGVPGQVEGMGEPRRQHLGAC
jgi:hypothetical protein